ncbi:GH25 family lysozyme [Oscillospiraceae bacterium 42-9]|jgi:GH25 family lysozyme M1 (1,4-beta-N-acetylmuramidase)|uniref:GH25 family lysozyme n=1 Tax=Acutalibacter sp. TaxID=1918636 RepID=UPI0034DE1F41
MADFVANGIDISEFNGDVNIAALKGKVDFIIIRCGYGGDYESQDDSQYWANVRKCQEAGIPFGVYLYSYARNMEMAMSEARHTLRLIHGLRPLYGVWYDLEDASLPTGKALVDNVLAYWTTIQQCGYYCGIYASLYWMEHRLNSPRLQGVDRWVAQWAPQLDYPGAGMWQYSDRGVINGKTFDLDRAFKNYPAIINGEEWTDMTAEEVKRLARREAQAVYDQNEAKYKTINDVPQWARGSVVEVYDRLKLLGVKDGAQLDASATYVRALYVIAKVLELMDEKAIIEGN